MRKTNLSFTRVVGSYDAIKEYKKRNIIHRFNRVNIIRDLDRWIDKIEIDSSRYKLLVEIRRELSK